MTKAWTFPLMLLICLFGSTALPGHAASGRAPAEQGVWPLAPRPPIRARFDPPAAPWAAGHRGVDLGGQPGQVVLAALPGTVRFAGSVAGKPVVVLDHGTTRTTYEPVAGLVEVGDAVPAGAAVGRLVAVGSHCAPATCLHLGWIRNADNTYLDPLLLLGVGPVRLYPWDGRRAGSPHITPHARVNSLYGDLTLAARLSGLLGAM